jgi:NAD(P)-dependent dehydrogenase (short-subunit alcohol dehydrogenase family)
MSKWKTDELQRIAETDDLHISPFREDGATYGTPTWIEETKQLASKVNATGTFDVVIHNAGVYRASAEEIFAVNTLAPYLLTCLIEKPKRLIYLSSDMHLQGRSKLEHLKTDISRLTYSDSKLHVLMLCKASAHEATAFLRAAS